MSITEAYRILELSPKASLSEVKKKYHELMMLVHPDVYIGSKGNDTYKAQEIITAYSMLKEYLSSKTDAETISEKGHRASKKQSSAWDAPINENAYSEREILQYVEDYDGTIAGNFCIAKGKYMWTADEDFSLFLLSLYKCGKKILDKAAGSFHSEGSPAKRTEILAELTYLLAQQFIAGTDLLKKLVKEEKTAKDGHRIFYVPAMLEQKSPNRTVSLSTGELLYPAGIRQHRLYLKNQTGSVSGYLSFADDRLYYIVVPLLEQKRVQVKVQIAEKQPAKKSAAKYHNLHLWIKLCDQNAKQMPENINLQIEQLLKSS